MREFFLNMILYQNDAKKIGKALSNLSRRMLTKSVKLRVSASGFDRVVMGQTCQMMTSLHCLGNVFVMMAILLDRQLQSVANYLILSLAVADLLVAVLVMPLGAVYEVNKMQLPKCHQNPNPDLFNLSNYSRAQVFAINKDFPKVLRSVEHIIILLCRKLSKLLNQLRKSSL